MEASGRRRIKGGKEYDHLFPKAKGTEKKIKGNADVEDTLELIRKMVYETLSDTKKVAAKFKGESLYKTCSNIWQFYYDHIQYKKDKKFVEQVRTPGRSWADRTSGIDCDCFSVLVSSTLINLEIPHFLRITKYNHRPYFQHIYVIVPLDGKIDREMNNARDYLVLDCVADSFNYEHPFTEKKDYKMDLNRLDGFSGHDCECTGSDAKDLSGLGNPQITKVLLLKDGRSIGIDINGDEYEMDLGDPFDGLGKISLRKIAKGAFRTVRDVAKVVTIPVRAPIQVVSKVVKGEKLKTAFRNTGKAAKKDLKKVGDGAGKVIRAVNKINPVTLLLRNGLLAAMKINLFNVAGRLRFAYWTESRARAAGWNMSEFAKLKKVRKRLETIFWQAGGKEKNLTHAILSGKGNRDGKVPRQGEPGMEGMDGLGEPMSAAAIAAASGAVGTIAALLNAIKSPEGCKTLPEPPTPTGDAKVDQQQQAIYQATVAACRAKDVKNALAPSQSYSSQGLLPSTVQISPQGMVANSYPSGTSSTDPASSGSFNWKPWAIGAGVVAGGAILYKNMNGKSSSVNGLSGKRKKGRKKKKVSTTKVTTVNF